MRIGGSRPPGGPPGVGQEALGPQQVERGLAAVATQLPGFEVAVARGLANLGVAAFGPGLTAAVGVLSGAGGVAAGAAAAGAVARQGAAGGLPGEPALPAGLVAASVAAALAELAPEAPRLLAAAAGAEGALPRGAADRPLVAGLAASTPRRAVGELVTTLQGLLGGGLPGAGGRVVLR